MACFALAAFSAQANITLVQEGKEPCPILLSTNAPPLERQAADQLARYLQEISGATFPVITSPATPTPDRAIIIGPSSKPSPSESDDGYSIKTKGQQLTIAGNSPQGTLYGVYGLLEDTLGCVWWSYDEEYVPKKTTLTLPDLDLNVTPPFAIHDLYNREAQNDIGDFKFKSRAASSESFTGNHTLYPLLTPYGKTHPEIYPANAKGERKANDLHFCYLADGISEALADALGKEVQTRQGNVHNVIYFAGMGDWYGGMCQCPTCAKIYEEEAWTDPDGVKKPGYTATLLRMINRTADILEKKYPGIRIGTFAYMSLEAPPSKTVPRENVVIWVPRLRHCTVHSVESCEKNLSFLRNIQRWCEIAPNRVAIWEYGTSFKNFVSPFPCIRSIAENIQLYHKLGIRGISVQGNYATTGSDLVVLKNYLWRKLLWNPDLNLEKVIRRFCEGYYGPAADSVMEYVSALDNSVREPRMIDADEFSVPDYLDSDCRHKLRKMRDRALRQAEGREPYLRRVKEATVGIEALALLKSAPLHEEDDQLIRKDLDGYTFPRALDLLASIRNAGPTEWGTGGGYWLSFLLSHGGPLVHLSKHDLELTIAPTWHGQIRQITFQGKPILRPVNDPGETGFPLSGGSSVHADNPVMRVVGKPSAQSVTLDDAPGIANGHFNGKASFLETIAIETNATFVVTAAVPDGSPKKPASVSTVYAKTNPSNIRVQYHTKSDLWENLDIPADAVAVPIPSTTAIRLTFSERGCLITDRYTAGGPQPGKLIFNKAQDTLTTEMNTTPGAVPGEKETVCFVRKFQISSTKEN